MNDSLSSHATRASLIQGVILRHPQAWNQMIDLYGPLIAFWCRQSGLDSESTSDTIQEVFLAVSLSIGRYGNKDGQGSFRSWLWRLTRNKIIDRYRREKEEAQARGGSSAWNRLVGIADPSLAVSTDEPTNELALGELMQRAIAQVRVEFESKSWQAFWRTAVDGMPTDVIAAELDMSPAAIRQARSRILRRLRLQLGD